MFFHVVNYGRLVKYSCCKLWKISKIWRILNNTTKPNNYPEKLLAN